MSKVLIDRSVVEQALSTLTGWGNYDKWVWHESALSTAKKNTAEMITALSAALEQPQVEHEPVAVAKIIGMDEFGPMLLWHRAWTDFPVGTKLYTRPQPKREPLTDQQIHDCFQHRHRDKATERRMITRAIEFAHGITGEQA